MPTLAENPKKQAASPPNRKPSRIVLRCFLWASTTGVYYAECVDLDIVVRSTAPEKAMKELHEAMLGYLHVAIEGGDTQGLVPRPSPLSHRLRYRWYCFLAAISINRRTLRLFDWSSDCPSFC